MKTFFTFIILAIALDSFAQVVLNEVNFAPVSPAKEWFEIYNSGAVSVDLQNWKWRDAAQSNPVRTITVSSAVLNPGGYAVICEDSANFRQQYPGINGMIIQSVGWNALNNSGNENLVLYNSSLQTIDSLTYNSSWGGTGGFSLERKNPSAPTNQQSNWGSCIDPLKATPLRQNSLTPKQNDLALVMFNLSPVNPFIGDTLFMSFLIKNLGINSASNFTLNIYRDINLDSIPQSGELMNSNLFGSPLAAGDSVSYNYSIAGIDSGFKQYIGLVSAVSDDDTTNNKLIRTVNVGGSTVAAGIIINEIMYAPQSPEPEWIELYNSSGNIINIKNWKISDSTAANNPPVITASDRQMNPADYLVIAKNNLILSNHPSLDTSKVIYLPALPTFNNDRDKVILFNNAGIVVDEVPYKSSWGGSLKFSLERISALSPSNDSANWASSLDCEFSTPARQNSLINLTGAMRNDLIINEIMYDPLTGNSEWLELYNRSGKYLNLTGWRLQVASNLLNLNDTCNFIIKPYSYLVFSSDTTVFSRFSYLREQDSLRRVVFNGSLSLTNDGAVIKILDVKNNVIDSLAYSPKWHNSNLSSEKGYSLERINPELSSTDPRNWSSSANLLGGTPGLRNSIFTVNPNAVTEINVSPNPFSPDGDGYEDFTIIKYKLKSAVASVRIKIFDVKGRLVRTITNNSISGSEAQIIFDGKNDSGEKLRIGIYVVFLEAVDDRGGTIEQVKTTLVIAAKL